MKKLLLALAFAVSPVSADTSSPPPDMFHQMVPFSLYCVNSFERMVEIMHDDFREVPLLMSHMSEISTIVVFTNKDKTTSTDAWELVQEIQGPIANGRFGYSVAIDDLGETIAGGMPHTSEKGRVYI